MAVLADFFIYCIAAAVDVMSYVLFQIVCILSLAVYHVVKLPGFLVYQLISSALLSIPSIMDYFVNVVVSVALESTLQITGATFTAVQGFVVMLANIFYDLFTHAHTALFEFITLVGTCMVNVFWVGGMSLLSIGKNFTNALYEFLTNM
ncbi:hypothetical protein MPTK1_3g24590 [Marchantia polymorpha subsp. ruderalis]